MASKYSKNECSSSESKEEYSSPESEDEYDFCEGGACAGHNYLLPFDYTSIEKVILKISDYFDFRVVLNSEKVQTALFITAGCVMAGSFIGKHYAGKIGAAVGGAVGGACGVGLVVVSMRDVWEDIKLRLYDMFDIVYDYLAGLGLSNYKVAMQYLMKHQEICAQLATIIIQSVSGKLGKKILSNLGPIPALSK